MKPADRTWHPVCRSSALGVQQTCVHPLPRDPRGTPQQAVLVRDAQGQVRAYMNRCAHIPIPLDLGSGDFLDPASGQLRCLSHGALYRLEDGHCTHGPCRGERLEALPCRERAGWVELGTSTAQTETCTD